jgi:hypothetical protein
MKVVNKNKFTQDSVQQMTQEELGKIQELTAEFNKAKMAIGDIEIQKQNILIHVDFLKKEFAVQEKLLIEKYGQDSIVNIQTGEITKKQ